MEVICTDALERIYRRHQWGWWGGWLGRAMRLHASQLFHLLLMSTVMPGQNTEASALAIMDDTP